MPVVTHFGPRPVAHNPTDFGAFTVAPVGSAIGAEVHDVDLGRPVGPALRPISIVLVATGRCCSSGTSGSPPDSTVTSAVVGRAQAHPFLPDGGSSRSCPRSPRTSRQGRGEHLAQRRDMAEGAVDGFDPGGPSRCPSWAATHCGPTWPPPTTGSPRMSVDALTGSRPCTTSPTRSAGPWTPPSWPRCASSSRRPSIPSCEPTRRPEAPPSTSTRSSPATSRA